MWSSRKATGPTSLGRWRGRGAGLRLTRSRLALLLIVLALLLGGGAWGAGLSPAAIFSRNTPSYISPDGAVSQDTKHPTSFGDADDLQQLAPPAPPLAVGSATVSGHITDAATGLPVTNANVGISLGAVGSGATYATTAADGSYSFSALAAGTYNLASSRYTVSGTAPLYQYATRMGVAVNTNVIVDFALNPIAVPGSRGAVCNRAQNLILIDYDETYYESWFTDPNSMVNRSPAIHSVAARGVNAAENWTSYGWSPIDHFQIAVGGYPAWRSPDAPAAVWGQPDGLDTNIWYNGSEHFLMSSVFDVAKSHGMATGVIGGSDYPTGHITDANVDLIQLAANPSGVPTIWATETENFITAHASNPNGFFIYLPATMAEGRTVESTSPDAAGGAYQTASSQDDQAMQTLLNWLQTNGYMGNTVIAFTADEAENDHTSFDNFYGNGTTGGGTTRHVPFTIAGPGIVSGPVTYPSVMNMDDESTNLLAALNLPPNVDSRGHLINAFFQPLNCGGGTPTAVPPTNTPVPGATATSTRIPAPTATNTPLPPPTNTPVAGGNLVVNGGFETGNISPWTTLLGGGSAAIATSPVHSGSDSGKVTTGASGSSGVGGGGSCAGGNRIAVTPNTAYTWSGWIFVPSGTSLSSARIRVAWYSSCSGGSQISTNDSSLVTTATGTWIQVSGSATAPAAATFAEIRLYGAPGGSTAITLYFDDLVLQGPGSTPAPTNTPVPPPTNTPIPPPTNTPVPPPTNTPVPPPTSTPTSGNLVVNGGFETGNISPWTTLLGGGSAAIATSPVHSGSDSGKVTTGASGSSGVGGGGSCAGGNRIAVTPNTAYTWSGWIFVPSGTSLSSARIRVAWYSSCSGGSQISTNDSSLVTTATGTWIQVSGSATSPGTATFAEIRLYGAPGGTSAITLYFDDINLH